ncbi:MAG TPA: SgcJ/EcaC family oxidoreductase [Geminicoccus sp.]|uniref:YybH family protein n=1 Tax=Geminicoccus sp. TaxID=2024832 RepID=UPI002CA905CC|nr:SgcJ/EcaC family oxidoreductase [Geminicoccus sp.]HWL68263.1 SgcJ/EcaC family oxidoreductase [Geminicoccus sp.]
MRHRLVALCTAAMLGTSPAWAETAEEAIKAANQQFEAAFNKGDAAGIASLYTSDAALLPPGEARLEGRPAIEQYWKAVIDAGYKEFTMQTQEVTETADGAVEFGRYGIVGPATDGAEARMGGKYAVLWRNENGSWHLHRDMWNDDPPVQN